MSDILEQLFGPEAAQTMREDLEATAGAIHDDGIDIEFDGACPVQGCGTADGRCIYYRSRWDEVELRVARTGCDHDVIGSRSYVAEDEAAWSLEEDAPSDGGFAPASWVHAKVSEAFIRRAVGMWREAGRP